MNHAIFTRTNYREMKFIEAVALRESLLDQAGRLIAATSVTRVKNNKRETQKTSPATVAAAIESGIGKEIEDLYLGDHAERAVNPSPISHRRQAA